MLRVAAFYHVTSSANRKSIELHGLDWRHGAGGIAGSLAPEQKGVFLARDAHQVEFFVRMGTLRFPALDVWEVTLDEDLPEGLPRHHPLAREFDGFLCWMQAIPSSQLRLFKRDVGEHPRPSALA